MVRCLKKEVEHGEEWYCNKDERFLSKYSCSVVQSHVWRFKPVKQYMASDGLSYASRVPGSKCDQFIGTVGAALAPYKLKSTPGFWDSATLRLWFEQVDHPLTSSFNDLPPQAHSGDLLDV